MCDDSVQGQGLEDVSSTHSLQTTLRDPPEALRSSLKIIPPWTVPYSSQPSIPPKSVFLIIILLLSSKHPFLIDCQSLQQHGTTSCLKSKSIFSSDVLFHLYCPFVLLSGVAILPFPSLTLHVHPSPSSLFSASPESVHSYHLSSQSNSTHQI